MKRIDMHEVIRLLGCRAQLLEVLERKQYEERHIPGALGLPLAKFSVTQILELKRDRPVIVYCWDSQ